MNQLSFFNTIELSGHPLQMATVKAKNQDELVLDAFKVKRKLTPSDCWQYLMRTYKISNNTPITSIRRSITVLSKKEILRKTENKRIGIFGVVEHIWDIV